MKEQNNLLNSFLQLLRKQQPDAPDATLELERLLDASESYLPSYEPNVDAGFARLENRMTAEKAAPIVPLQPRVKSMQRPWLRIAAAVVLLVGALTAFQFIFFTDNTGLLTASTDAGEMQTIELADGTIVRLNANSSLSYPIGFADAERKVTLTGEAFFEVTKNAAQPFVIQTDETLVRVLGTSFSVRARAGEDLTKVVVKTGKVEVTDVATEHKVTLSPYEEAIHIHHGNKLKKIKDSDLKDLAWHTLDFRKIPVSEVIEAIENHYQVDIDLAQADVLNCLYTINFADSDLATTLEILKTGLDINITQSTGNQYIISGGTCKIAQ